MKSTDQYLSDILLKLDAKTPILNGPHSSEGEDSSLITAPIPQTSAWATVRQLEGPEQRCRSDCLCQCHLRNRQSKLRLEPFKGIIGSLAIVHSGWELAGPSCNRSTCRRARYKRFEVEYRTSRQPNGISVIASVSLLGHEPSICLAIRRTPNVVDENDTLGILGLTKLSVSELRRRLELRPDAIMDVDYRWGMTALHCAPLYKRLDTMVTMLMAGADPFQEDHRGFPAISDCFREVLQEDLLEHEKKNLLEQLPLSVFFDEYNFTHLERVVLGLRPLQLQAELGKVLSIEQLNCQDDLGMTPLHWATIQNDSTAVKCLLESGAQVNIQDKRGRTALLDACRVGSEQCTELLLAFGADTQVCSLDDGYSLLHVAAEGNASRTLLSALLSAGADIDDKRNIWKATPLARGVTLSSMSFCKSILDFGADIDHQDWEGDTALIEAMLGSSHACIPLLLSRGADYLHKNFHGQTILHKAAKKGDENTFRALSAAKLKHLDPNAKDRKSMVARQYFAARSGVSAEAQEEFEKLLEALSKNMEFQDGSEDESSDDDDDEVCFDAPENP